MKKYLLIGVCALFLGCAQREFGASERVFVSIKSEQINLSGTAILRPKNGEIFAQVYSAGQAIGAIKAGKKSVCINDNCVKNSTFNDRVLGLLGDEAVLLKLLQNRDLLGISKRAGLYEASNHKRLLRTKIAKIIVKNLGL